VGSIAIVDLGRAAGTARSDVRERLARADAVVVAGEGDAYEALRAGGITCRTYADLGLAADASSALVVEALCSLAEEGDVVLAAAGYPFLRSGVVSGLLARSGRSLDIYPVVSPLEVLLFAVDVDVTADVDIVDDTVLRQSLPARGSHLVITGVRNAIAARKVAERLAERYPDEHPVVVAGAHDAGGLELKMTTVAGLSDFGGAWTEATIYVAPVRIEPPGGFDELVRIMRLLRDPDDGCPWDLEQTHMSLRGHVVEEAYEALAAIEEGDDAALADELGDILLQVVFHSQIASEAGTFTIDDPIANIIAKLRRRHPHIFGTAIADTPEAVMTNWDIIKRQEKADAGRPAGVLDGIAPTLPALTYAEKISRRAVSVGFEWETVDDVWDKVHEEIDELKAEAPGTDEAAGEVGDLLFTVVNVARKMGVDPEMALRGTCAKFIRRFGHMEQVAAERGDDLAQMGIDDMETLWQHAKAGERAASQAPSEEADGPGTEPDVSAEKTEGA
jgi:tetrapyrrole methylase family protein/MazG family protein